MDEASNLFKLCPLGTSEVFVASDVVYPAEREALVQWAETQLKHGKLLRNVRDETIYSTPYLSSSTRMRTELTQNALKADGVNDVIWIPEGIGVADDTLPEAFWDIRQRIIELMGLGHYREDPYKGCFLGYGISGGGVHQHKDSRLHFDGKSWLLLRCNVLFARPDVGGMPVIEGQELTIPDGGMWAFYPSERVHSATLIEGQNARGLLSFGVVMLPEDLLGQRFCISKLFRSHLACQPSSWQEEFIKKLETAGARNWQVTLYRWVFEQEGTFSAFDAPSYPEEPPLDIVSSLQRLRSISILECSENLLSDRGKIVQLDD
jgi:hypothetical protein